MIALVLSHLALVPVVLHQPREDAAGPVVAVKPIADAKAILIASDSEALRVAYRRLFKGRSNSDVRELFSNNNDGIALQSAWESVIRSLAPHLKDKATQKLQGAYQPKSQWFLGFVQGRLGVTPPKWWSQRLLTAEVHDRFTLILGTDVKDAPFDSLKIPVLPRGHTSKVTDTGQIYSTGKQKFAIPASAMAKTDRAWDSLRMDSNENGLYVTSFSRYGFGGMVEHIARDRGKLKLQWVSSILAEYPLVPGRSGIGHVHWIDLRWKEGRVVVFGSTDFSMYIEGFSTKDGACLFRFGTSY